MSRLSKRGADATGSPSTSTAAVAPRLPLMKAWTKAVAHRHIGGKDRARSSKGSSPGKAAADNSSRTGAKSGNKAGGKGIKQGGFSGTGKGPTGSTGSVMGSNRRGKGVKQGGSTGSTGSGTGKGSSGISGSGISGGHGTPRSKSPGFGKGTPGKHSNGISGGKSKTGKTGGKGQDFGTSAVQHGGKNGGKRRQSSTPFGGKGNKRQRGANFTPIGAPSRAAVLTPRPSMEGTNRALQSVLEAALHIVRSG